LTTTSSRLLKQPDKQKHATLPDLSCCPTALHGVVEVRPLMERSLAEIRASLADTPA
jgi:hypothetical protein